MDIFKIHLFVSENFRILRLPLVIFQIFSSVVVDVPIVENNQIQKFCVTYLPRREKEILFEII